MVGKMWLDKFPSHIHAYNKLGILFVFANVCHYFSAVFYVNGEKYVKVGNNINHPEYMPEA